MPSLQAIMRDIHDLGLDPTKNHKETSAVSGRIRVRTDVEDIKSDVIQEEETKIVTEEEVVVESNVPPIVKKPSNRFKKKTDQ